MKYKFLLLIISIVAMTGLSSCHSSKLASQSASSVRRPAVMTIDPKLDPMSKKLMMEAQSWLGTKYKYGGHSRKGTDCSGMVMEVFLATTGIKLPRNSAEQQKFCKNVKRTDLVHGDLIFFSNDRRTGRVGHVGIYVGDGKMIHASTSKGVMVSMLDEAYWTRHYAGSGRVEAFAGMVESSKRQSGKKSKKSNKENKKKQKKSEPIVVVEDFQEIIDEEIDSVASVSPQWMDSWVTGW
ncbi:MAG: C40 family peptidase [Muribaculaceae bacterium]|nr:C40 family peptidase [Muribaculaceae bacterium]